MKIGLTLLLAMLSGAAIAATTTRVNVKANGDEATGGNSFAASVSADGNKVAFSSLANNLDPLDTNAVVDVYLKDLSTSVLKLVSIGANGVGTASSNLPQISADGNFIAFVSTSPNLVANDTNAVADVFVYRVSDASLERVSVSSSGTEANGGSGAGICGSNCFSLSSDGRYVVFESSASNLAALDTDTTTDIYLRDRQTGTTTLVSQTSAGALGTGPLGSNKPSISANGRFIAFESSRVLEASDSNNTGDIYLRDTLNSTTVRVNTSATGAFTSTGFSARPSLSADGSVVAFRSLSNELVPGDNSVATQRDVFAKNLTTGAIVRATPPAGGDPNGDSNEVSLSGDGKVLIFHSAASNFVSGDNNSFIDVFRMLVATGAITRISVASDATEASNESSFPDTNQEGSATVFESIAANLVANDSNARTDIFLSLLSSDTIFANGFE
jgi:Tol biopolymer transport system component